MSELLSIAEKVTGKSFKWIAEYAYPNGSILRCVPCGKQRSCNTSEIAEWMERGFPRCKLCGHITDLINPWAKAN
jgi:hypothetical protein